MPEGDAVLMAEVGAVPIGRWHSPWVDGRWPTGADETPIAGRGFRFCPSLYLAEMEAACRRAEKMHGECRFIWC